MYSTGRTFMIRFYVILCYDVRTHNTIFANIYALRIHAAYFYTYPWKRLGSSRILIRYLLGKSIPRSEFNKNERNWLSTLFIIKGNIIVYL